MPLPSHADVRRLLDRIRPSAKWGWKGGPPNDPAQLRWRDTVQTEPTETEFSAEQTIVDVEDATSETTRLAIVAAVDALEGEDFIATTLPEMRALFHLILLERNALNNDGDLLLTSNWNPPGDS